MKTVGSVLKAKRLKKGLKLAEVEQVTKIKTRILAKIESDDIEAVGSFGHFGGLVKNYGEFLDLDTNFLLAILRRQANFSQTKARTSFSRLPNFLVVAKTQIVAILVLAGVFSYLIFQLINLRAGPKLEVSQPLEKAVFNLPKIQISGATDPEAQVLINGQKVPTSLKGEFSAEFELKKGINVIEVVVKGRLGAERKIVRTVELSN